MILNGYSGIAGFAALLRIALGVVLVFVAVSAARRRDESESRYYLGFVLGATLFGVAVAAWPLFYLVLQSYVGLWPDVMCIDGVVRIGAGSANASAHLPGLIAFLQVSKPALIFVAGAWLVLHLVKRNRAGSGLRFATTGTLLVLGLLGTADGLAEGAYLLIPKQEQMLATGCCTVGSEVASFAPPAAWQAGAGSSGTTLLTWAFFGVAAFVVAATSMSIRRVQVSGTPGRGLALACVGAAALVPLGTVYLREVGAPLFLRLPYHQCAYCLVALAPESLVGVGLFGAAIFSIGWAVIAQGTDRSNLSLPTPLLRFARFGILATLLMIGVRMVTA